MRYELMLPHQIRRAIERNLPVLMPLGVLEYHGEHMAVGMDMLAVTRILDRLELDTDIVVLPPFAYGAASYAVEPPEGRGSVHVSADKISPIAEEIFFGLLRVGFRNIHGFIHHQTENFVAGMPTDLAFKLAGRQAIFRFLEAQHGEGWWGREDMRDYYVQHDAGVDPFNWIRIHPLMDETITSQYPFDHAGIGETSLMMALAPEAVDPGLLDQNDSWYTETAKDASSELGEKAVALILSRLRMLLAEGTT